MLERHLGSVEASTEMFSARVVQTLKEKGPDSEESKQAFIEWQDMLRAANERGQEDGSRDIFIQIQGALLYEKAGFIDLAGSILEDALDQAYQEYLDEVVAKITEHLDRLSGKREA